MMWHKAMGSLTEGGGSARGPKTLASFSQLVGSLDEQNRAPLYQQLRHALRDAIEDNRLAVDEALPPERELAEEFGISRITVRKALDALVGEGLLTRRQGAGTFVTARGETRVEKSFSKLSSFSEDMISRGRHPESVWLSRSSGTVTPEEALTLGLSPGSACLSFQPHPLRRWRANGAGVLDSPGILRPCRAEVAVRRSLYEALGKHSVRPVRALQRLRAILFTGERAKLMGIDDGAPGLLIERRSFLADGRPVEVTKSYYRGDAYDFVAELNTSAS